METIDLGDRPLAPWQATEGVTCYKLGMSNHAAIRIEERGITPDQIKAVLTKPTRISTDQRDTKATSRLLLQRGHIRVSVASEKVGDALITTLVTISKNYEALEELDEYGSLKSQPKQNMFAKAVKMVDCKASVAHDNHSWVDVKMCAEIQQCKRCRRLRMRPYVKPKSAPNGYSTARPRGTQQEER